MVTVVITSNVVLDAVHLKNIRELFKLIHSRPNPQMITGKYGTVTDPCARMGLDTLKSSVSDSMQSVTIISARLMLQLDITWRSRTLILDPGAIVVFS